MINKKFLTRLLGEDFRKNIMCKNHKFIESKNLKLKAYATYVVDKYNNDRDKNFIESKEANYGYSPLEVIAYVANDGSMKKVFFEFNSVSHFLKKNDHGAAVEVVICILAELVRENKKDVACFDIDKIDAYFRKIEQEWLESQKTNGTTKQQELSASI